jgi:hypothetical protein
MLLGSKVLRVRRANRSVLPVRYELDCKYCYK